MPYLARQNFEDIFQFSDVTRDTLLILSLHKLFSRTHCQFSRFGH